MFDMSYNTLVRHHRGVAQLVARAVWDREVEGSSPFTPTKKDFSTKEPFYGVLFSLSATLVLTC